MGWREPYNRIAVVGSSNTDLVVMAPHIPAPGETVLGSEFMQAAGGKGANQAVAAARLGAHVTLITRVGRDHFGHVAVRGYREAAIDTRYVVRDPEAPTGVGLVVVDETGENAIAVASGANAKLSPVDVSLGAKAIRVAAVLLLQLEVPLEASRRAIEIARKAGRTVILNPAPAAPVPGDLLGSVDILTPNAHEAIGMAGHLGEDTTDLESAARTLLGTGASAVVVTRGEDGALVLDAGGCRELPAPPVKARDTTGAGDAFNGALAVAMADGMGLDEAVASAQRVAAVSVTRLGAQPSLPTPEEVDAALGAGSLSS